MKRQLTNDENTLTQKGLKRQESNLKELKENLEYNKKQESYQETTWVWDDYDRPIKRKNIKKKYADAEKMLTKEIEETEQAINELKSHLKEGVEIKIPTGVQ